MNRGLLLAVLVAAAAALVLAAGAAVGRNLLLPSSSGSRPQADVVVFKDASSKISLAYPAGWKRRPAPDADPDVALLVASGSAMSLLVRVTAVGLAKVTATTLPIVRELTDDLVAADTRVKALGAPEAVELGGLPGYRYRYRYGTGATGGAHVHYFVFSAGQMIQLVFQAMPAERLPELDPIIERITSSFRGDGA